MHDDKTLGNTALKEIQNFSPEQPIFNHLTMYLWMPANVPTTFKAAPRRHLAGRHVLTSSLTNFSSLSCMIILPWEQYKLDLQTTETISS